MKITLYCEDNNTFKEYKYSASGLNEFTAFKLKFV